MHPRKQSRITLEQARYPVRFDRHTGAPWQARSSDEVLGQRHLSPHDLAVLRPQKAAPPRAERGDDRQPPAAFFIGGHFLRHWRCPVAVPDLDDDARVKQEQPYVNVARFAGALHFASVPMTPVACTAFVASSETTSSASPAMRASPQRFRPRRTRWRLHPTAVGTAASARKLIASARDGYGKSLSLPARTSSGRAGKRAPFGAGSAVIGGS